MVKLEIDIMNLSAGDLQYVAGTILRIAQDKQAIADNQAKQQAEAVLARQKQPTALSAEPEVSQPKETANEA